MQRKQVQTTLKYCHHLNLQVSSRFLFFRSYMQHATCTISCLHC